MSRREEVLANFIKFADETERRTQLGTELFRKGYGYIKVTDAEGKPVAGRKVTVKLRRHAFLHGANLFMLDEMETPEKNEAYKKYFAEAFNEATVPIYWRDLEPVDGRPRFDADSPKVYRRPALDLCLDFCEKNEIIPKAHCLTYVNFNPKWVDEYDFPALRRRLDRRYRELAERYADRIPAWEVVNETLCTRPERDANPYFEYGDIVEDSFLCAEKYFPYNELIINEASHIWEPRVNFAFKRSAYYRLVAESLRKGRRIDAIGMQFHAFRKRENEASYADSLYNPRQIYRVLDTYATLGLPIQITEITIPAFSDSDEDYAIQAEILERLYRIWFSHPAIEAAIYWNLPDGYAAWAPQGDMTAGENYFRGGLLDYNLQPKPAYEALRRLFNEEWTTDVTVETDAEGKAKFLGFFGEYDICAGGETERVTLRKTANPEFVVKV